MSHEMCQAPAEKDQGAQHAIQQRLLAAAGAAAAPAADIGGTRRPQRFKMLLLHRQRPRGSCLWIWVLLCWGVPLLVLCWGVPLLSDSSLLRLVTTLQLLGLLPLPRLAVLLPLLLALLPPRMERVKRTMKVFGMWRTLGAVPHLRQLQQRGGRPHRQQPAADLAARGHRHEAAVCAACSATRSTNCALLSIGASSAAAELCAP